MIDEYRAEMNKPVEVFDPAVGKNVVYRFKPPSVDLIPIAPEVNKTLTSAEIRAINAEITGKL